MGSGPRHHNCVKHPSTPRCQSGFCVLRSPAPHRSKVLPASTYSDQKNPLHGATLNPSPVTATICPVSMVMAVGPRQSWEAKVDRAIFYIQPIIATSRPNCIQPRVLNLSSWGSRAGLEMGIPQRPCKATGLYFPPLVFPCSGNEGLDTSGREG